MSWFDLKQSAAELPSLNQGISKLTYEQVSPTREVTGTNFPKGAIHIRWEVSGVRWWIPNRSYLRLRVNIQDGEGNQPKNFNDVAPNMGMCAALFQSAELRIADKTVSRVEGYLAQVDALTKRLKKSKAWMDGIGDSLEQWNPDFETRQNQITSDGFISDGKTQYVAPDLKTAADVGMAIGATGAVTTAKLMTFAGADDIRTILNVGDRIVAIAGGAWGAGETVEITNIIDATTCNIEFINFAPANRAADAAGAGTATYLRVQDQNNNISRNRSGIELIWQPCLSIFNMDDSTALPSGKFELILTPRTSSEYQISGVESLLGNLVPYAPGPPVVNNDFRLVVNDMYFQLATVDGPSVDNVSYFLSLEETRCQATDVGAGAGAKQKNFDVSPSTYALTAAFQAQNLQDTRNSQSKFKFIAPAGSGVPSGELMLDKFYLQYDGSQKPQPDSDPNYVSPDGFINSRYVETLLYSNAYFDQGGGESLNDYIDRGLYMYFAYPKDGSSESTRVNVNFSFKTNPTPNSANLLLFDHHKKMVLINVQNGRVIDVIEQDG